MEVSRDWACTGWWTEDWHWPPDLVACTVKEAISRCVHGRVYRLVIAIMSRPGYCLAARLPLVRPGEVWHDWHGMCSHGGHLPI